MLRIASAGLALAATLLAGCQNDSSPLGPGPSGNSPATASGAYANEPADLELIAHSDLSEAFPWGPGDAGGSTGSWWQWEEGDPSTSLHAEGGTPLGPHFNRTRYEAGMAPAGAPVHWGGWKEGSGQQGDEYERIYFSQHIRLADPGTGDWESQQIGTKLGFFGAGRCSGANNEIYQFLEGGTRSEFTVRLMQQNVASEAWKQNRETAALMRVGEWHHWEIEMVLNDIGSANGIVRWWIDGELVMDHDDVVFRTEQDPCGFLAYKWNPTWGGTGGPNRTRADHIDISDIRISGRPLD